MEVSSVELTYTNLCKSAVRCAVTHTSAASGMIAMFGRCEGMMIDCIRSNIHMCHITWTLHDPYMRMPYTMNQ